MAWQAAQMTTFLAVLLTIADSIINDNSGPGVDNNAGFVTIIDSNNQWQLRRQDWRPVRRRRRCLHVHGRWENSREPHRYQQHDQW